MSNTKEKKRSKKTIVNPFIRKNMADNFMATDGGKIVKMEVDYSDAVTQKIPICEKLTKEGKLTEALDQLLALEKQTRTGSDTHSTSRVLIAIVRLCFEAKQFDLLNEQIVTLSKKRSQIKQSITAMIQECCTYVDKISDKTVQLKFIETLRNVTAGKIHVECERARLTLKFAHMKEAEGKIAEAAECLQELQVETFGSMDRKEKIEVILEQMRLCLAKKDFIRASIISKKIQTKNLEDPKLEELKFKYYNLMIDLEQNQSNYFNICKHLLAIFNTPSIKSNVEKRSQILKNATVYIVLAEYNNHQSDTIHNIKAEKAMLDIPHYHEILKLFTTCELINWSQWEASVSQLLRQGNKSVETEAEPTGVFANDELGNKRWNDLKKRAVEHNIRVMAKYYSKITLQRMSEHLGLNVPDTEEALANLVTSGTIWAKIDRSTGIINFKQHQNPNEVLNSWSNNVENLLGLVGKINHLINKEEMIHHYVPAAVE